MAYTTINKPSEYFNTKLYTGNGTTNAITGVGFQPDLLWIKARSSAYNHNLYDAVRGLSAGAIISNTTDAEDSVQRIATLDADGFTTSSTNYTYTNASGTTYVAWNWLANGAGVSNTDGSITSTVSANTTSGFSIVKWTGTGGSQSNVTIGHGLNATPKVIIFKQLDTGGWIVYHEVLGSNNFLTLNATDASTSATGICNPNSTNIVLPTSYLGTNSTAGMIAYCFAEKKGFSKFGSYVGNSPTSQAEYNGAFIYTGFKPAFVILKQAIVGTVAGQAWYLHDNKRTPYNPSSEYLSPNSNNAETSAPPLIDLLSNGFKINSGYSAYNDNGSTFIYMAFAEEPLVGTNGVPATAR